MKLTTATEHIGRKVSQNVFQTDPEALIALKIAYEAMKRCQEFKKYTAPGVYMPLPGETEDD